MCIFFAFTTCNSHHAPDTMAHQHPDPIRVEKRTKPYSGKSQTYPWISHLSSLNSQFSPLTSSHKLSFPKSQDATPSGNLKQAGQRELHTFNPKTWETEAGRSIYIQSQPGLQKSSKTANVPWRSPGLKHSPPPKRNLIHPWGGNLCPITIFIQVLYFIWSLKSFFDGDREYWKEISTWFLTLGSSQPTPHIYHLRKATDHTGSKMKQ